MPIRDWNHSVKYINGITLFFAASAYAQDKPQDKPQGKLPNIIQIVSDDHGFRHSEPYGDTFVKTPNMNRLAKESMLFDYAFAASPLCSPSRCCIATGVMPHRNGGDFFGKPYHVKDVCDYLKPLGYQMASFGKWGITRSKPGEKFDLMGGRIKFDGDTKKVCTYLKDYKGDKPLFVHIGASPPHLPWGKNKTYDPAKIPLPPNYVDTPETRLSMADYYSDVSLLDTMLGDILDALDEANMKENTILIFTSDQGAHLPFGKWCLSDGGVRVPFMVRWPGHVKPGVRTNAMISLVDLVPTYIEAAKGKIPEGLDGKSLVSLFEGKTNTHREVVFSSHSGNKNGSKANHNECPMRTVRTPKFRYIFNLYPDRLFNTHIRRLQPYWTSWEAKAKTDDFAKRMVNAYEHRPQEELYDLTKDPFGMNNLAANPEYASIKEKLRKQVLEWSKTQNDPEGVKIMENFK